MNRHNLFLVFACIFVILSLALVGCQSPSSGQATTSVSKGSSPTTQMRVTTPSKTSLPPSVTAVLPSSTKSSSPTPTNAPTPMGPKILWSFLGSPEIGPVVDGKGNIYFGSWDQWIYSLTPSGEVRWKFAVPEKLYRFTNGIAIGGDGLVYICTVPTLYALDNGGRLRWKLNTPKVENKEAEGWTLATSSDGTIYLSSAVYGQGKVGLCAISPDGQVKWQFVGNGSQAYLGIGPKGTIYLGTRGSLYAVQPDGTLAWELKPKGYSGVVGAPTVAADGTVYVQTEASSLLVAVSSDGVEKWRSDIAPNQAAAFGADGTIYVGGGASGWTYHTALFALSPSGKTQWQFGGNLVSTRAVVGSDGTIYFGTLVRGAQSAVYAANKDGSFKWRRDVDAEVTGLEMGPNGVLYVTSEDGCLYALSTKEQETLAAPYPPWNTPPAATTGILGWRVITGSNSVYLQVENEVYLQVRLAKLDYNYWMLTRPDGKKSGSRQTNKEVLDIPMGHAPKGGHYSLFDNVLPDAKERMSLDFAGAKISVVNVQGVGDYVYLEVKNTGDLPTSVKKVNVTIKGRNEYNSQFSTWGTYGITLMPGQTTIFNAHYFDPRPGGPWGEVGTPIGVTLSYDDIESGTVILVEQKTTLGPLLSLRGN